MVKELTTAKDGLLCITKQLTRPGPAQPSPTCSLTLKWQENASVVVMVLILTVTLLS